ncbi:MAG: YHS domain-containing (seleno)protein [Flavobacterium sp.]|uniref:YHS domain-containing (seleno)protein n=1 Tax=Flavobacterium TaxID=237 RepID=UPI00391BD1BA
MKNLIQLCLVLMTMSISAQNNLKDGVAIQGYDPVAYFVEGKAVLGLKEIKTQYDNATYYFATDVNKEEFVKNPDKFVPQYGGYCAYGLSKGYKAPIDPKAFTIVEDKLYLNYSLDVKAEWMKQREERIVKANENWEKIKNK